MFLFMVTKFGKRTAHNFVYTINLHISAYYAIMMNETSKRKMLKSSAIIYERLTSKMTFCKAECSRIIHCIILKL